MITWVVISLQVVNLNGLPTLMNKVFTSVCFDVGLLGVIISVITT
jgi:hypothetical protein